MSLKDNDLIAVETYGNEYAGTWFAGAYSKTNQDMWGMGYTAKVIVDGNGYSSGGPVRIALGIRPVVTLKNNVAFKQATTQINETQTWDIE